MKIIIRSHEMNLTAVNVGKSADQTSDFLSWVGIQFAQRKHNPPMKKIVHVFGCNKDRKFEDIPPEW
jgi:hypothetical protein